MVDCEGRLTAARFGLPVLEGDGPTECGPVTCVNPLDGERKPGSVGLPIPGVEMRILDNHGGELANGEVGDVCVRGPNVMKGYWNLPEANAESFFGDWFRTGDLGYRDEDGYFFLIDRKKDMIIVNGMNVYPRMVEEALYCHPAIAEAAVVGEPHATYGEIPVVHIVPKDGVTLDSAEVRAWCREHLGRHEVPRKVLIRGALDILHGLSRSSTKLEIRDQPENVEGLYIGKGSSLSNPYAMSLLLQVLDDVVLHLIKQPTSFFEHMGNRPVVQAALEAVERLGLSTVMDSKLLISGVLGTDHARRVLPFQAVGV